MAKKAKPAAAPAASSPKSAAAAKSTFYKPPPRPDLKPTTKTPPDPLPKTLTATLPVAGQIVALAAKIEGLQKELERAMARSKKEGAISLARSFAVLHRLADTVDSKVGGIRSLFEFYKTYECPEVFEQSGITHVPLAEGFRVGISYTIRASIRPEFKDEAYQWLRSQKHGDVIQSTVNSSTLSALARVLQQNENRELPERMFNVVLMPNTSVTKT